MKKLKTLLLVLILGVFSNCSQKQSTPNKKSKDAEKETPIITKNPQKNLYWGDTHLHTNFSTDAFIFGTVTATPDDAYRFAKGEEMTHPVSGQKVQLKEPLDFLVVADHAEGLGFMYRAKSGEPEFLQTKIGQGIAKMLQSDNFVQTFINRAKSNNGQRVGKLTKIDTGSVMRSIWKDYVAYADKNNEPGKFTAFIGWEWTSYSNSKNLHRVIFTPINQNKANDFLPYSAAHSNNPEKLWNWLEKTSKRLDIDFVSIPHNSNISGGLMFPEEKTYSGNPIDKSYAHLRAKWEGIAEITQIKGTSESHSVLSPTDEYADFEQWYNLLDATQDKVQKAVPKVGSYVRSALKTGLKLEEKTGVNPYKLGIIGSTDAHTAMSGVEEDNFQGKFYLDGLQANKSKAIVKTVKALEFSSGGYAAVWAESNTREDIFAAFKRKEVYATSGPRIQLRFFAGYDFKETDIDKVNYVTIGYKKGVPMGSDLMAANGKPLQLMIHAVKDPKGANLDRVQVVKGWLENGETKEKIFNVKWAGNRQLDQNGKLPAIGNTVNTRQATYTNTIGAAELAVVWKDPEFNPRLKAFYYIRVLEIPTPRYSTYASAKLGVEPWEDAAPTIQERAYSSPIWYNPN